MSFSQSAMYAMRAMSWLAHHADGVPHRSGDIAARTGIPDPYLSKVLRRLVVAGLVDSKKGRSGGFSLSRSPSAISFADILGAVDSLPEVGLCVFGYGRCDVAHPCSLHPVWARYVEHTDTWARTTTLADLGPMLEQEELEERLAQRRMG